MRQGKIVVAKKNEELLFETQGMFLDLLVAHDFYCADIEVLRNSEVLASFLVREVGTIVKDPMFFLAGGFPIVNESVALLPESFFEGDELVFKIQNGFDWDVDFPKKFAISEISKRRGKEHDEICKVKNDEEFEKLHRKYLESFNQDVGNFSIGAGFVFRRRGDYNF